MACIGAQVTIGAVKEREAAQRLGAKSRNAYARYERGDSVPTVEKLDELLQAVAPGREIVVRQSDAA